MRHVLSASPMFGKFSPDAIQRLTEAGYEVTVLQPGENTVDHIISQLKPETVAIVSGLEKLDGRIMDQAPNLKAIVKHGIGVDNIDLEEAKSRGIHVYNEPGSNSDAVADLAMGLIFTMARSIVSGAKNVASGGWSKITGVGVWGKTLGILGFGNVGRLLALRGRGLQMRVLAYDPYFNESFAKEHGIEQADIDTILTQSDFISLHMPLMDSTRNMINESSFARMKDTAILINTARGGLVDETALYHALRENKIAGAAFDAFAQEPPVNNLLFDLPNFVGTPHMGANTTDAVAKTSSMVTDTLLTVLAGEEVRNRVV